MPKFSSGTMSLLLPEMLRSGLLLFVVVVLFVLTTSAEAADLDLDTSRPAANLHSLHQYALLPDGVFVDSLDIRSQEAAEAAGITMTAVMDMYMEMEIAVSDGESPDTTVMDIELSRLKVTMDQDGETFEYDSDDPQLSTLGEDEAEVFDFLANTTQHIVMSNDDGEIIDYEYTVEGMTFEEDDLPLDDTDADSALGVDITSKLWNIVPDKDIAPGDSWDVEGLEMGDYFLGTVTGTSTLQGYSNYQSQYDVAVFYTEGSLLVEQDRLEDLFNKSQLGAALDMSDSVTILDDDIAFNATFYLDPTAKIIRYSQVGQTYTLVIDLGSEMDEMVGGPMQMPITEFITTTSALKEDGTDASDASGSDNISDATDEEEEEEPTSEPEDEETTEEPEDEETTEEPEDEETTEVPEDEETTEAPVEEVVEPPMIGGGDTSIIEAAPPGDDKNNPTKTSSREGPPVEESSTKGNSSTVIMLVLAGIVFVVGMILCRRRRNSKSSHTMVPQDLNFELT